MYEKDCNIWLLLLWHFHCKKESFCTWRLNIPLDVPYDSWGNPNMNVFYSMYFSWWIELIEQRKKTHYFRCHWNTIKLIARIGSRRIMFKGREKATHKSANAALLEPGERGAARQKHHRDVNRRARCPCSITHNARRRLLSDRKPKTEKVVRLSFVRC